VTLAGDKDISGEEFFVEDVTTGVHANGYGRLGDGRSFSFHIERKQLVVDVYRPRLTGPVPNSEDVVACATRGLTDIDLTDARSLIAAVRDAVANAQAITRNGAKPTR
jgi:hypothetical protein